MLDPCIRTDRRSPAIDCTLTTTEHGSFHRLIFSERCGPRLNQGLRNPVADIARIHLRVFFKGRLLTTSTAVFDPVCTPIFGVLLSVVINVWFAKVRSATN
jgi:hypothetical protein